MLHLDDSINIGKMHICTNHNVPSVEGSGVLSQDMHCKKDLQCLQKRYFALRTLPSDAAEKRRHTAVGHCCALFRHIQCIMCMYLILSGPLMRVSYLLTIRYILKWEMLRVFVFFACFFYNFMKITTKSP